MELKKLMGSFVGRLENSARFWQGRFSKSRHEGSEGKEFLVRTTNRASKGGRDREGEACRGMSCSKGG